MDNKELKLNRKQLGIWRILETYWVLFKSEDFLKGKIDYHITEKNRESDGPLQKHHSNNESQTVKSKALASIKRVQLFELREIRL